MKCKRNLVCYYHRVPNPTMLPEVDITPINCIRMASQIKGASITHIYQSHECGGEPDQDQAWDEVSRQDGFRELDCKKQQYLPREMAFLLASEL